jgi:hypothetical protein
MSLNFEAITAATVDAHAARMAEITMTMNETANALNELLYGDDRKYTRWEWFVWRWKRRLERVRDAWLVLTGQAHVGDW